MKKNKDYTFKQIEEFATDEHFDIEETGEYVGCAFIVLRAQQKDCVISFVLTGYNSAQGNLYTCVYSDKN